MFVDQHRRETEDWLTKHRLYIDAQKEKEQRDERTVGGRVSKILSGKGKKLDVIM